MSDLISPWHPINNPVLLKALGKLMEELGECQSAAARCVIQGVDEKEPTTGKVNRRWLEEEIADVRANVELVEHLLNLDVEFINKRKAKKYVNLLRWHSGA